MPTHSATGKRPARITRELLLALNVGFAFAFVIRVYAAARLPRTSSLANFDAEMILWFNTLFHLRPRGYNQVGVELTFVCWTIGIAITAELLLHLLERAGNNTQLPGIASGLGAVLVVPAAILYAYIVQDAGIVLRRVPFIDFNRGWLILETAAAGACFIGRFVLGWWHGRARWGQIVVLAHSVFWAWIVSQLFTPVLWALLLAAIPASIGVSWFFSTSADRPI